MEILKRAKGNSGEIVPWNASPAAVKDEVFRRAAKAGYMTRDGHSVQRTRIQNTGYGKSKLNVWPRDENGKLIGD